MRALFAMLAAGIVAVSGSRPTAHPSAVASVDTVKLDVHLDTALINTSFSLTARTVDSVGRTKNAKVTWIARDSSLFRSLKQSGAFYKTMTGFVAGDTGRTYIVATSGAKKDSALMIVRDSICDPAAVLTVNLFPDSITAHRTDSLSVVSIPRNYCGGALVKNLTWISSDSSKVTVTRLDSTVARIVSLDSSGTVYIKGVSGSKRDSTKVKLKAAP